MAAFDRKLLQLQVFLWITLQPQFPAGDLLWYREGLLSRHIGER